MNIVMIIPYIMKVGKPLFFVGKRPKNLIPEYISTKVLWQFPTGKVGDNIRGESIMQAALRELGEELGVESFKNFINNNYSFNWMRPGETKSNKETVFAVELESDTIHLDQREFEEHLFLDERAARKKLFFPSHKKFLNLIASDIKKNKFAKIIVLSGPGGSGKETVLEMVSKKLGIERAKTVTSRKRKEGEGSSGRIFVSEKKFLQMKNSDEFIETNHFKDNYYGSLRSEVESRIISGKSTIIELDLNGLIEMEKKYSNVVSIFIKLDLELLRERMVKRGRDSEEEIEKRMKISVQELKKARICDYIITNKDGMLENTVGQIVKIIGKEKGII